MTPEILIQIGIFTAIVLLVAVPIAYLLAAIGCDPAGSTVKGQGFSLKSSLYDRAA